MLLKKSAENVHELWCPGSATTKIPSSVKSPTRMSEKRRLEILRPLSQPFSNPGTNQAVYNAAFPGNQNKNPGELAMTSPSQPVNPQPTGRQRFGARANQFWRRVTDGLELNQLWNQFRADAR